MSDFAFVKKSLMNTDKFDSITSILEEVKSESFKDMNLPLIGSEVYTPPEVLANPRSQPNAAYDIWALG